MGTQTEQPGGAQTEQPGASPQEQGKTKGKSAGKAHTVEGCIVKEESDYFLVPKSGSPVMLQAGGGESPSGHEGHHVKVKGAEQPMSAAGGAGATGGAAGTASSTSGGETGSQAGQAGAMGSQTGQAGAGGAAGGGQLHQNASKMIVADQITMVSENCPANWNSKYSGAGKTGPGGSSGSQGGSTQTPPPMF
jgi:hypothetical protein